MMMMMIALPFWPRWRALTFTTTTATNKAFIESQVQVICHHFPAWFENLVHLLLPFVSRSHLIIQLGHNKRRFWDFQLSWMVFWQAFRTEDLVQAGTISWWERGRDFSRLCTQNWNIFEDVLRMIAYFLRLKTKWCVYLVKTGEILLIKGLLKYFQPQNYYGQSFHQTKTLVCFQISDHFHLFLAFSYSLFMI